jgi:hypothetical protein
LSKINSIIFFKSPVWSWNIKKYSCRTKYEM